MSLRAWKKEFYKKDAKDVPAKDSLEHSILKWKGLTRPQLKKHHLLLSTNYDGATCIVDKNANELEITDETCALCVIFTLTNKFRWASSKCVNCPLHKARGGIDCDQTGPNEEDSPYSVFAEKGNARPMQIWLARARKYFDECLKNI